MKKANKPTGEEKVIDSDVTVSNVASSGNGDEQEAEKVKGMAVMRYIGPPYKTGLLLPDGRLITPATWSEKEMNTAIKRDPTLQRFFRQ